MRTLARPLPDELLYSTLARATYRYAIWSPKGLLDTFYGQRTRTAVPDLPSNLGALARATADGWKLSAEELAVRHTLVGYFTHFAGTLRRTQVLRAMEELGQGFHTRLGVCAGAARAPKRFQLCRQCHAEDLQRHGQAYWHRAHHLPGVLVCHLHGDALRESDVPFRPVGRNVHQAAPIAVDWGRLPPLVGILARPEQAKAVAAQSYAVLTADDCAPSSLPDYRPALARCGWHAGRGGLARLQEAFEAHFGADLLERSFGRGDSHPSGWLAEVLRTPRRPMHVFKHVLLRVFLDGQVRVAEGGRGAHAASPKRWGLYRRQDLRREAASLVAIGLSTHAVAWCLDVDWKTANRLLIPLPLDEPTARRDLDVDRQSWEENAAAHSGLGKKALRATAPALYARLYRTDRDWLVAWAADPVPSSSAARRVAWPERDRELVALVHSQVDLTLQMQPPHRVSRSWVLGVLGLRALLAHRARLLPCTVAALDAACESVAAFQLRRLTWVLGQEGMDMSPEWRVWRVAGIAASRLGDGGSSLMQTARARHQAMANSSRSLTL